MHSVVNVSVFHRQGLKSTQDELAASAFLTVQLDDSMGGAPVQVCVIYISKPQCEYLKVTTNTLSCAVSFSDVQNSYWTPRGSVEQIC